MPTISDVVRLSGVSQTTVSRVLNGSPHVSHKKRELVLNTIKELGYTPNPSARRLRGQSKTMLGVIVPIITNPFFAYLVNYIENTAYENGYHVLVFQSHENVNKELAFLNLLKAKQIDGLIMTSIENKWDVIEPFTKYGPIVLCNEYNAGANVPTIRLDQCEGTYLGIRHLIQRGHKKIAYCTGGLFADEGKDRDRNLGYQKALNESGLTVDPRWIFVNKHSIEDGKQVMEQILQMHDRPTAIFTGSDEIAGGLMIKAKQNGISIPNDIAIVGFDDQPIAEMLDPRLTTIRQPVKKMGEKAMQVLIDMLNQPYYEQQVFEFPVELVIREST